MTIRCVGCGYSRLLKLEGTAEELEAEVHNSITEGWRWSENYHKYVCPECCKSGGGPLLVAWQGKIEIDTKVRSYKKLLFDLADYVRVLKNLEELTR